MVKHVDALAGRAPGKCWAGLVLAAPSLWRRRRFSPPPEKSNRLIMQRTFVVTYLLLIWQQTETKKHPEVAFRFRPLETPSHGSADSQKVFEHFFARAS